MTKKTLTKKTIDKLLKDFGVVLLEDSSTHIHRMEIRSETSERIYIVSQRVRKDGGIIPECSCPGWIFKRHCKHLEAIAPLFEELEHKARPSIRDKNIKKIENNLSISEPKKKKLEKITKVSNNSKSSEEKDDLRILDIIKKADGDNTKILSLCERMARSITKVDKSQKRAIAAKKHLPKSISQKAYKIFWRD